VQAMRVTLALTALGGARAPVGAEGMLDGGSVQTRVDEARRHMALLEYEQAIALLEPVLHASSPPALLGESYLVLVEAHVYRGNVSAADSKERQLWHDEAASLIRACLGVRELRHVSPEPRERYPSEMVELFDEVRREMFGSFEIGELEPREAEVTFEGTLLERNASGILRRNDVPIGTHELSIRHPGYREIIETIEISPATVAMRSFTLERERGFGWYATRVIAPVAVIAGAAVIITRTGGEEAPLPGPPDPPELR